ncbi:SGNH/GDSL hydrolase family protein [Salipaludibacillus daqingensis]|uniref:SGNH/GDSL hydrolase family protein n=1 Tax=Salipaludibacillus daqingensis TaxID=3041001 RepID=UPI002475A5B3|nr:SGNH/GDSL hydrolase family protein [Salipaludibacillus daqingensis]
MKRCVRFFILLIIITLMFPTIFLAGNDDDHANKKETLVAIGDSIPFGYNLGDDNGSPSNYAFPYLIGLDAGMLVPNLAVAGWRSEDLLTALESQLYRRALHHADYITLNIGNNDLIEALFSAWVLSEIDETKSFDDHLEVELEEHQLFRNLKKIIATIRGVTDAPVIIYNIYNPFQTHYPMHDLAQNVLPEFNETFEKHVHQLNKTQNDVILVDAYSAFGKNQKNFVIDGGNNPDIHPTIAGQRKLADIGLEALDSFKEREARRLARKVEDERFAHVSLTYEREQAIVNPTFPFSYYTMTTP